MKQIFVVDDDFEILYSLNRWLVKKHFVVKTFSGSLPLLEAMQSDLPDLVLLDINLKGEDGRQICKQIKERFGNAFPVVLFSSLFKAQEQLQASGADGFIGKHNPLAEVTQAVNEFLRLEPEHHSL